MLQRVIKEQPSLSEIGEILKGRPKPKTMAPLPEPVKPIPKFSRQSLSFEALSHFESVVESPSWRRKMRTYLTDTAEYLTKVVPPQRKVLVIGCLATEILESLNPSVGVGLDVNEVVVKEARQKSLNKNINYYCSLPEDFETKEKFDYVIVLNFVDHCQDIAALSESLKKFVHGDSRVIFSMMNPLWHGLTKIASLFKIRIPDYERNLVASRALCSGLESKQFRIMDLCKRVLLPRRFPLLAGLVNQYLARLPVLNSFCFIQYVTAKVVGREFSKGAASCSVIIPCYNEEGNVEECIKRVPLMGSFTEILVVNDGSKDRTLAVAQSLKKDFPNLKIVSYEINRGKGNAVLEGMRASKGDIMMILDADMTVPPEELVDFYDALDSKSADFASGTRFLYPMEKKAMKWSNYIGNILFSKLVQVIVGSECTDTLCGTKAMRRSDFTNFNLEDSAWGDFDLIFHAAKHRLKCVQVPVHYKSRMAGVSKMKAFSSGISFLKLCFRKWSQLP